MDSLQRLQGLHEDLRAFAETRLANIDRLWQELQASIQEFKKLLDKPVPSASAREAYNSGKITVDDQDYGINDEFRHLSRAIGTALDLDEVEAGRILIEGSNGQSLEDDFLVADIVGRFHDRRDLLLQTLRITLEESLDLDLEPEIRTLFRDIVLDVLNIRSGPPSNASVFAAKCLKAMEDVENWLVKVHDQIQTKTLLSQVRGPEFYATLEFQRSSLFKQHEALGAILAYLFRGNFTISEDLRKLHAVVKRWERLDMLWIHYLPAFSAAFERYGSPEGSGSANDAKSLNGIITSLIPDGSTPESPSQARPLQAVLELWWTAEYSGWYKDPAPQDSESEKRSKIVKTTLDDHALEFLLSICSTMHLEMWRHTARQEMIGLLVEDSNGLLVDYEQQTSPFFYTMLMESIESFAESWISNMPDSIRRLKNEEDDQRLQQLTAIQQDVLAAGQREVIARLHLETFLVLMAFAFEHRPNAAEQFWEDADGNLYGFLQWASKRQTVPRVGAFCEMLCAISEGPENAEAAHKFLLDESVAAPTSRSRRIPTMNYQQIFAELELYARKVHEKNPTPQLPSAQNILIPDLNEVESPVMLTCYLRLLAHLSRNFVVTRQYIIGTAGLGLPRTLLLLASGPIPSYLRAAVFNTLESLLSDKDSSLSNEMWKALDEWASSPHDIAGSALAKVPGQEVTQSQTALQVTLSSISTSFDQYDAFVTLLRTLLAPIPATSSDGQPLPFPSDLGSSYRSTGITPYVDFVCGQLFSKRLRELGDDGQALLGSYHCLDFVAVCLEGFNESYATVLDRNAKQQDGSDEPQRELIYAQRHPFARIMQWVFSADMNKALLQTLRNKSDEAESALPDSPLVLNLLRCIDVINMVLDLQHTYFDIIKPMSKESDTQKGIRFIGVTSFEESVATRTEVILDLCQYAASGHSQLSLRSLSLLQKLTGSPKLNNQFGVVARGQARLLIDMLGPNVETVLQPTSDTLAKRFQLDIRELEDGFEALGYLMKDGSLAFLNACLSLQPEMPNIAHLLLGFRRISDQLSITSSMDNGVSLFNSIVDLVIEYPDAQDGSITSWLMHIKTAGLRVLRHLWAAPVSSDIVLSQLRRLNFMAALFLNQTTASQGMLWDGNTIVDPDFWFATSAEALTEFFLFRANLYDYVAKELVSTTAYQLKSVQKQVLSILQGKFSLPDGTIQSSATIFDLFDFADLNLKAEFPMPELLFFTDLDFELYKTEATDVIPELYAIDMIRELLHMRQSQILEQVAQYPANKPIDADVLQLELDGVAGLLEARNRWSLAHSARRQAIHKYVDMVICTVEGDLLDRSTKAQFMLHLLQILLPKLDIFIMDEAPEATELARATDSLLMALSRQSSDTAQDAKTKQTRIDNVIAERLFQVFRICLEGISISSSHLELRTMLYSICSQYLTRILNPQQPGSEIYLKACKNSMDCVRSVSQRLISVLSDDAEDGSDSCRLNALNLLSLLTSLAGTQKSTLIIDSMVKANILEIILEPLRNLVSDLANTSTKYRSYLLSVFESRMFLLLQISRTRAGASALLDAGFIQALRDSMIFRADPDLGMDVDTIDTMPTSLSLTRISPGKQHTRTSSATTTSALQNYFALLSNSLRTLLSTFFSRGLENEQSQFLMRSFLLDHRPNMVGVFKKAAGVNGRVDDKNLQAAIDECVKCYTGLAVGCGFVDFEDESAVEGLRGDGGFS